MAKLILKRSNKKICVSEKSLIKIGNWKRKIVCLYLILLYLGLNLQSSV